MSPLPHDTMPNKVAIAATREVSVRVDREPCPVVLEPGPCSLGYLGAPRRTEIHLPPCHVGFASLEPLAAFLANSPNPLRRDVAFP